MAVARVYPISMSRTESQGKAAFERSARVSFANTSRERGPTRISVPYRAERLSMRTPEAGRCSRNQCSSWRSPAAALISQKRSGPKVVSVISVTMPPFGAQK